MFETRTDSVRATLTALHRGGSVTRSVSIDAWRILSHLDQDFTPPRPRSQVPLSEALVLLNRTITTLAAFSGLGVENMTWSSLAFPGHGAAAGTRYPDREPRA